MAGGTWTKQDKVRPGVYINFTSESQRGLSIGSRGVVAICEPMSWGPVGKVMEVEAGADTTPFCGFCRKSSKAVTGQTVPQKFCCIVLPQAVLCRQR